MIPRLSLSAATLSDKTAQQAFDRAFADVGFVALTDTGMPNDIVSQTFAVAADFFHQASEDKAKFGYQSATENFGYQGVGEENLDPAQPADLKETFTMRNVLSIEADDARFPSTAFASTMHSFYQHAMIVAERLQRVVASLLDLPEAFFVERHHGENITLRLLYYPPHAGPIEPGQLGAGAHCDYGLLTLLFQRAMGGLEVQDKRGDWLGVSHDDDVIVVNVGDLLERWTNTRYRSTRHRVQPQTTAERFSIALFIDPDSDTSVTPLPSCVSASNPARFPPTTAGEHLQAKLAASHKDRYHQ